MRQENRLDRLAGGLLIVCTLIVALVGEWYAFFLARFPAPPVQPAAALLWQGAPWVLAGWCAAMIGVGVAGVRRRVGGARCSSLTIATLVLGAVHVEALHLQVHVACVYDGLLSLNCAPWLPSPARR